MEVKKKHKYHAIKCFNCKTLIKIDECMKNEDYEKIGNKYLFYCPVCGNSTLIKIE